MGFDPRQFSKYMSLSAPTLFGVFAVLILLGQSFTVIEPGFRGISIIMGSVDPHYRTEGITMKWPFIERIVQVPIKQITVEGMAETYSSDLQTVNVHFKAMYRLPEGQVVNLYRKIQGDPYIALLEPRIQDALKQVTARYRAEDLVKNREKVKEAAKEIVRRTMKLDLGMDPATMSEKELAEQAAKSVLPWVYLEDLPISNIDLTAELEKAIEMKQIKEQEALAKEYELKKAVKQAEIVMVEAQAEADAVRVKGNALKSSPEVVELEIAKKWDGKAPSTVVVGKGGSNVLLPLR